MSGNLNCFKSSRSSLHLINTTQASLALWFSFSSSFVFISDDDLKLRDEKNFQFLDFSWRENTQWNLKLRNSQLFRVGSFWNMELWTSTLTLHSESHFAISPLTWCDLKTRLNFWSFFVCYKIQSRSSLSWPSIWWLFNFNLRSFSDQSKSLSLFSISLNTFSPFRFTFLFQKAKN